MPNIPPFVAAMVEELPKGCPMVSGGSNVVSTMSAMLSTNPDGEKIEGDDRKTKPEGEKKSRNIS